MTNSRQITSKRTTTMRITALVMAGALVLAACGGDDASETTGAPADAGVSDTTVAAAAGQGGEAAENAANLGSGAIGQPVQTPITAGRDIIFTAEMTVSVDDVAEASKQATDIISSVRGFLFGQRAVSEPEPTNILVFKVPPNRFQEALAALGDVGEIRNQTVSADDVTEAIVDLESRIATTVTSVERLRTLLEGAETVKIITDLETQLLARETSLEQMRGQLRTLENQVGLATITVAITQSIARPSIAVEPTAYLGFDDEGTSCPGEAGLRVVEGETITFCLEIFNTGDTAMTNLDLRDAVIDKEFDDFFVVFGDLNRPLEPGQSVVLATSLRLERTLRSQTRVTATPLNEDGSTIEGRTVANTSTITLAAADPGGIPGFSDGLSQSWEVLANLVKLLILALGALIPFIWVIPLIWLALRWRSRKEAEIQAARERGRRQASPPTPPHQGESPDEPAAADDWELADDV